MPTVTFSGAFRTYFIRLRSKLRRAAVALAEAGRFRAVRQQAEGLFAGRDRLCGLPLRVQHDGQSHAGGRFGRIKACRA